MITPNSSSDHPEILERVFPDKSLRVIMTMEQFLQLDEAMNAYHYHGNEMTVLRAIETVFGDALVGKVEQGYRIMADVDGEGFPDSESVETLDVRPHNTAAAKEVGNDPD
jgi:hypothetical protein